LREVLQTSRIDAEVVEHNVTPDRLAVERGFLGSPTMLGGSDSSSVSTFSARHFGALERFA
jgi:hypothetical protein